MNVSGKIDGLLLSVSVAGAQLQCETNADFSYEIDMLPATNPDEGRWRKYLPGVQGWTLGVNGYMLLQSVGADFKTVIDGSTNGERFMLRFGSLNDVIPSWEVTGYAYLRNAGLGAPSVGKANWTLQFIGDGAFTTNWDEFGLIIDANPIEAEWPTIYDANPA